MRFGDLDPSLLPSLLPSLMLLGSIFLPNSVSAAPPFDASAVRPETMKLIQNFVAEPLVCDSEVGVEATTPECYLIVHRLAKQATAEEIRMLTGHPAPGVRANALIALLYAERDDLFLELIPDHFHDSTRVTWHSGSDLRSVGLAEIVLSQAWRNMREGDFRKLQEALLYFEDSTDARYMAFQTLPIAERHEQRVRELAKQRVRGAVLALAHYKRDSDVAIIRSTLPDRATEFYAAVQIFPHEAFKEILEERYKSIMAPKYLYYRSEYFAAIAAYRDDWARSMLRRPYRIHFFQDPAAARSSVMYAISVEKQIPYYRDLIWEFSDSEPMTGGAFRRLCDSPSSQCTEYVHRTLTRLEELNLGYSSDLVGIYTDYLKQSDAALLKEVIIEQLDLERMHIPRPYLKVIQETRDPDYVEPALEYIEESPEQWSQRDLGIVLLKYGDADIKERLMELRKRKSMLRTRAFQEALDQWKPRKAP
ncbi:MAG: hypothetical protein CMN76_01960 [Spirochaetaceae bacterium]|nr:hypothetical protein [Spirochaetaceae bacterium]